MTEQSVDFSQFFAAWELFRDPALTGALAGALLGMLGVYVVLRRMVFLSAALSQSAGLGVAGAWYAQLYWGLPVWLASPTVGAMVATLVASAAMLAGRSHVATRRDGVLGQVYLIGAAGTLAIGTRIVQEVQDIESILFGSAVAVLPEDFAQVAWLAGLVCVLHLWAHRGFVLVVVDADAAQVRRLPVRTLELLLVLSLAVAVSVCTRVLGALPVFAFTVLPAMAALRLSPNVSIALLLATVIGAASGFGGYLLAFRLRLPVGASQALVAAGFSLAATAIALLWARLPTRHENHSHGPGCGHEAVPHGDHVDFLVGDHLHHQHADHCDDHGTVDKT